MRRSPMKSDSRTALLFSDHQWDNFRIAGFHMIARSFAENGYDVGLASSPLSWTGLLRRGDQFGFRRLWKLATVGAKIELAGGRIHNFTTLSGALPGPFRRAFPQSSRRADERATKRLIAKTSRYFPCPDFVCLESIPIVKQFHELKAKFNRAKFVYRPSDPLLARASIPDDIKQAEIDVVNQVDLLVAVNARALDLYRGHGMNRSSAKRTVVLPNGFDAAAYTRDWDLPIELAGMTRPIALYFGASAPYWEALLELAKRQSRWSVVIVCPVPLPSVLRRPVESFAPRLRVIPGVPPERIASFVANADAIAIAYPPECAHWTRGPHSKIYQAIAARKPIVGLNLGLGIDIPEILNHNEIPAFIGAFDKIDPGLRIDYAFGLGELDWKCFRSRFFDAIETI